jgi:hypothetical protein
MQVPIQLIESLISEFDRSESDPAVALCFARVQLPEGDHGLAVTLLVKGYGHPESIRVVVYVLPVIENQPFTGSYLKKYHSVVVTLTARRDHVESPYRARFGFAILVNLAAKPAWTKPSEHALRLDPGKENLIPRSVNDTR